jgi:hypothetical protein
MIIISGKFHDPLAVDPQKVEQTNIYFGHAIEGSRQAIQENRNGYTAELKENVWKKNISDAVDILEGDLDDDFPFFVLHQSNAPIVNYAAAKALKIDKSAERKDQNFVNPELEIVITSQDIVKSWIYAWDEKTNKIRIVKTLEKPKTQ